MNWSTGMTERFRPIVTPESDYTETDGRLSERQGAHSWPPMSFSPQTGLVYIPTIDAPAVLINLSDRNPGATIKYAGRQHGAGR